MPLLVVGGTFEGTSGPCPGRESLTPSPATAATLPGFQPSWAIRRNI